MNASWDTKPKATSMFHPASVSPTSSSQSPNKKRVFVTSYSPSDSLECVTSSSSTSPNVSSPPLAKQLKLSPPSFTSLSESSISATSREEIISFTSPSVNPIAKVVSLPDTSRLASPLSVSSSHISECLDRTKNLSDGRSWSKQLTSIMSVSASNAVLHMHSPKSLPTLSTMKAIQAPVNRGPELSQPPPASESQNAKSVFFSSRKRHVTYNARPWQGSTEDSPTKPSASVGQVVVTTLPSSLSSSATVAGAPGCSATFVPPGGFMTDADMMPPPALPPPPRLLTKSLNVTATTTTSCTSSSSSSSFSSSSSSSGIASCSSQYSSGAARPALKHAASVPGGHGVSTSGMSPIPSQPQLRSYVTMPSQHAIGNVKDARECQERGEEQNLLDDIHYLIEGIKPEHSVNARALSIHNLITKCLLWNFRRRLRNRKILERVLRHMQDSTAFQLTLSFFVASFLYVLLRNTDAGHLDSITLSFILRLLRTGHQPLGASRSLTSVSNREAQDAERLRMKLLPTLEAFHKSVGREPAVQKSLCKHMKLDRQLKVFDLMMELLLSFNNRKNSALLKEELRLRGGLEALMDAAISAMDYIGDDLGAQTLDEMVLERMRKLFYYMRLLEDVTFKSSANQEFLVNYKDRAFLQALTNCLRLCVNNLPHHTEAKEAQKLVNACLMGVLRLLLNISCNNEYTSERLGSSPYLLDMAMHVTLRLTDHVRENIKTDVLIICLGLMVNLAEHCEDNRARIMHLLVSADEQFEQDDVFRGPAATPSESKLERVSALKELVQLFTKLEQKLQEHEFEKVDETQEGSEEEESDEKTTPSATTSHGDNVHSPPLKFHFVEAGGRKKVGGGGGRSLRSGEDDEALDALYSHEELDSPGGADVEFEAHTLEERKHLQQKLDSAEVHMGHSMVCAYLALLLGCLLQKNTRYAERIRQLLPGRNFRLLTFMLAKLYSVLQFTQSMSEEETRSVEKILRALEAEDAIGDTGSTPH